MRTDVIIYIDGVAVDGLDYGVTDPRKGYLGSENWTKLELTTPGQTASKYEEKKREKYSMMPNFFYPCKIEAFGRWGTGLKNQDYNPRQNINITINHSAMEDATHDGLSMFKSFANHLNGRVQVVMERNQVADRENAGLKPISDEEQYRIVNFGALTFVSTIKG